MATEAVPWSADRAQGAYGSVGSDAPPHPRAGPLGTAWGDSRRARPSTAGREDNTPCEGVDHSGLGRYGVREPWAVSWAGRHLGPQGRNASSTRGGRCSS
jgi:hypothetical protein